MILFNFRLFFKLIYLSLFKSKGTHARLTRKRALFLLGFFTIFIPGQLINGIFLLLDWIFFPEFNRVEVNAPVFIVGNPRTGSTHLLRVLARDEVTFAVPKLWELVLAPSITQRKIVRGLVKVDHNMGSPVRRWLKNWQKHHFREEAQYHRLRLTEPDEDELNFLTNFSAIHLLFAFPFWEAFQPFISFDEMMLTGEKQRFMIFYKLCMQRTLYVYGRHKTYLSKTPANSARVRTLCEYFPGAKFLYTARNPLAVFPSTMSLFSFQWGLFSDLLEPYPFGTYVLETINGWYKDTLRGLEEHAETYTIVKYPDLVQDLAETIRGIYSDLGLVMNARYAQALGVEVRKAHDYTSRHKYNLEDMGFTPGQIIEIFQEVFDRFGFDTLGEKA